MTSYRHTVHLIGSRLEVALTDDGVMVTLREMYHHTLPEARDVEAIVAACDVVEWVTL